MGVCVENLKLLFLSFFNFCLFYFYVFSEAFYLGLASNVYNLNIVNLGIIYYIHQMYSVCTYKHLIFY
jgi:hypothetical protein